MTAGLELLPSGWLMTHNADSDMESLHVSDPRRAVTTTIYIEHVRCAALRCCGLAPKKDPDLAGTGMGPVWEATIKRGSSPAHGAVL